jgi:hypothetical protein
VRAGRANERPAVGVVRPDAALVMSDADAAWADTAHVFPGAEIAFFQAGGRGAIGSPAYGRHPMLALRDDEILLANGDFRGYDVFDARGTHVGSVRADADLTLTDADMDSFAAAIRATSTDEETRALLESFIEEVPRAEKRAGATRMLVDAPGNVWLADRDMPFIRSGVWHVFARSGRYLGIVALPSRLRPLEIGDTWMLSVRTDSLDVQSIRLDTLIRARRLAGHISSDRFFAPTRLQRSAGARNISE